MAASAADWIARSAWHLRSPEFGPLVSDAGTVGIELPGVSDVLWRQWVGLPRYPTIIQALRPTRLRYTAIDWTIRPIMHARFSHSIAVTKPKRSSPSTCRSSRSAPSVASARYSVDNRAAHEGR